MPRPVKRKKVCCLPETNLFGPLNAKNMDDGVITMSVEEYETIRFEKIKGSHQYININGIKKTNKEEKRR